MYESFRVSEVDRVERFEVFTAVNFQVMVWVVTSCSDVVRYLRSGGPCCLHLLMFSAL